MILSIVFCLFCLHWSEVFCLFETDWNTYGFSNKRNSLNTFATAINAASAPSLVNIWNLDLTNYVVAQSVVALNVDMSFARRSLLETSSSLMSDENSVKPKKSSLINAPKANSFASTSIPVSSLCPGSSSISTRSFAYVGDESGYFYGIDIDAGCVVWSLYVGAVNYTQCVDLPSWGVSGAAVFNRTTSTVYVVGGNATLYALSMQTGAVKWTLPNLYNALLLTNYGALTLHNEVLYLTSASRCDFGEYLGGVYAVSTRTRQVTHTFYPSQSVGGGGVWGLGGVTIGTIGAGGSPSLYIPTGNALGPAESAYFCEQVVRTSLDLRVIANTSFPINTRNSDEDFGSTATLFNVPDEGQSSGCASTLLSATRKDGLFVVLNAETMQVVQTIQLSDPTQDRYIYQAAWDSDSNMLIVPTDLGYKNISKGLVGYKLNSACQLVQVWNTVFDFPSSPTIVGPVGSRVVVATGSSIMYILDIRTGAILMHKYGPGGMASVSAPVVVDDLILVSNVALSVLSAFKITPTPSVSPSAVPTSPTIAPSTQAPTFSIAPTLAPITGTPTKPSSTPTIPTSAPVTLPPSMVPTGPKPGWCLEYNGIVTGCSGCQYCPDGSLCNLCHIPTFSPSVGPTSPRLPSLTPTRSPTSPTLSPSLSPTQPTGTPILNPSVLPSQAPLTSQPTAIRPGWCAPHNGIVTGCSDCQYCPDGTLCNLCPPSAAPTGVPSSKPTSAPSTPHQPSFIPSQMPSYPTTGPSSSPSQPSRTPSFSPASVPSPKPSSSSVPTDAGLKPGWCPFYNGIETGCSGCQYCPDGSQCNLCQEPTLSPSLAPVSSAPVTLLPTLFPTRASNSTSSSSKASSSVSDWVSQNQTIFGVIVALATAILCVLFVLCLRRVPAQNEPNNSGKGHAGSPMILDPEIMAPSPNASPMKPQTSSSADSENGNFGVMLTRFSNSVSGSGRKSSNAEKSGSRRKSSISLFGVSTEPTRIDLCTIPEGAEVESPPKKPSIFSSASKPAATAVKSKPDQDRADLVGARQKILDAMARNKAKQARFASSSEETQL